ncbi:MAG: hypothetical protein FGM14_13640 [Flavobacteriales bacterium]|nr:hypothetical protein [Flavobacteriales bacterium]
MKIEHHVWFPEIVQKSEKEISMYVMGFDVYKPEDFNLLFAMEALCAAKGISEEALEKYQQFKQQGFAERRVSLPNYTYSGPLADEYTRNQSVMDEFRSNPDYQNFSRQLFEACHFDGEMPMTDENLALLQDRVFEIERKNMKIMQQIQREIGLEILTTSWPRLPNNYWDYSLPTQLTFEVFKYEESFVQELQEKANAYIASFSVEPIVRFEDEQEWKVTIKLK